MTLPDEDPKPDQPTAVESAEIAETRIATVPSQPVFDARELCAGKGMANIVLDDKVYTLRITKAEKLILTK